MIVGILLAAGMGRRFGGDKMLYPLQLDYEASDKEGKSIAMGLQCALNLKPWVDQVVCVVRPQDEELIALFHKNGFTTYLSDNHLNGLSASLVAGIQATLDLKMNARMWQVALGDMPYIQPNSYQQIRDAINNSKQDQIIQPVFNNIPGHPVVFPHRLKEQLLGLMGDEGARSIVKLESKNVHKINVNDDGIHRDVDVKPAALT